MSGENVVTMPQTIQAEGEVIEKKIEIVENPFTCALCGRSKPEISISNIDVTLCQDCSPSVEISINKESKRSEDYDEWKDEVRTYTFECKRIHVTGEKWAKTVTILQQLTDDEMKCHIEFHKLYVQQLELEVTNRKIKKSKQAIAVPFGPQRRRIISTEETKTKTVRSKRVANPEDIIAKMIADMSGGVGSNLNAQKLIEMLQLKLAKKKLDEIGTEPAK